MFEYKGKQYSLEGLQKSAAEQGYNFDEYLQAYKDDGMIEVSVAKPSVQKLSLGGFEPVGSLSKQQKSPSINVDEKGYSKSREKQMSSLEQHGGVLGWMPDWWVSWSTSLADNTIQLGQDVLTTFESEKLAEGIKAGKTKQEMIDDGTISAAHHHFDVVQKELNKFAFKVFDDKGKEMNVVDLAEQGRIGDAGQLAAEQAVSNLYSFLATAVNPLLGAAVIGTSAYGSSFENNLMNRYDPETMTDEDLKDIRTNSILHAGAEFAGEYIGGRLWRSAAGLTAKGTAEEAVKEYGRSFMERAVKGYFGGFGSEFFAEGLTNSLTQLSDQLVYEDEKDFKDYFRGFINDGIVGGLLGGGLGGGMRAGNALQKEDIYLMASSKEHQQEVLKVNVAIQKAKAEMENASDRTKLLYQKRIDLLTAKKEALQRKLNSSFDNMTQAELQAHAKSLDDVNKLFDVYADSKNSVETRKSAKKEIQSKTKI